MVDADFVFLQTNWPTRNITLSGREQKILVALLSNVDNGKRFHDGQGNEVVLSDARQAGISTLVGKLTPVEV